MNICIECAARVSCHWDVASTRCPEVPGSRCTPRLGAPGRAPPLGSYRWGVGTRTTPHSTAPGPWTCHVAGWHGS